VSDAHEIGRADAPAIDRTDPAEVARAYIEAYIYGSVARGEEDRHSDLDIVVVRETEAAFFDRMREIMDLRRDLGSADMWIYTPAELDSMLAEPGRHFLKNIVETGYRIERRKSILIVSLQSY